MGKKNITPHFLCNWCPEDCVQCCTNWRDYIHLKYENIVKIFMKPPIVVRTHVGTNNYGSISKEGEVTPVYEWVLVLIYNRLYSTNIKFSKLSPTMVESKGMILSIISILCIFHVFSSEIQNTNFQHFLNHGGIRRNDVSCIVCSNHLNVGEKCMEMPGKIREFCPDACVDTLHEIHTSVWMRCLWFHFR